MHQIELSTQQVAFLADLLGKQSCQVGAPDFPRVTALAAATFQTLLTALDEAKEREELHDGTPAPAASTA